MNNLELAQKETSTILANIEKHIASQIIKKQNELRQAELDKRLAKFDIKLDKFSQASTKAWDVFHDISRMALLIAKNTGDCRPLDKVRLSLPKRDRLDFIRYAGTFGKLRFDTEQDRFLLLGKKIKKEWADVRHVPPFRDFERVKKNTAHKEKPSELSRIEKLAEAITSGGTEGEKAALILQVLKGNNPFEKLKEEQAKNAPLREKVEFLEKSLDGQEEANTALKGTIAELTQRIAALQQALDNVQQPTKKRAKG